jgi:hypothetical protein
MPSIDDIGPGRQIVQFGAPVSVRSFRLAADAEAVVGHVIGRQPVPGLPRTLFRNDIRKLAVE